jgi:hypothetical protein
LTNVIDLGWARFQRDVAATEASLQRLNEMLDALDRRQTRLIRRLARIGAPLTEEMKKWLDDH